MREVRVVFMAAGLATFSVFRYPITHTGIYSGNGHLFPYPEAFPGEPV